MSHIHRFYSAAISDHMPQIELSDEEAHHAIRVARVRDGEKVSVFDGNGLECAGEFERTDSHSALIRVQESTYHRPSRIQVTLAVGGLHRDKTQESVVRCAAELGAYRVCFWNADHSQRPIKPSSRWHKTAVEACKQCGRFFLPKVDTASSLGEFLEGHNGPSVIALLSEEQTGAPTFAATDRLAVVIGPEGDFSDRERTLAATMGAIPISLGENTYRSEVAAALLMTLVAFKLDELGPGLNLCLQ